MRKIWVRLCWTGKVQEVLFKDLSPGLKGQSSVVPTGVKSWWETGSFILTGRTIHRLWESPGECQQNPTGQQVVSLSHPLGEMPQQSLLHWGSQRSSLGKLLKLLQKQNWGAIAQGWKPEGRFMGRGSWSTQAHSPNITMLSLWGILSTECRLPGRNFVHRMQIIREIWELKIEASSPWVRNDH